MLLLRRRLLHRATAMLAALVCVGPIYAQATLTPNPQDFGSIVVGQSSAPIAFTFTNNSASSEIVNSVVPSNSSEFPVQPSPASTCPGIVPAHGACTISIVFTPTATGSRAGQVTVNSTDATNPTLTLSLTGTGIAAITTATLTPSSATFPDTTVGNSSSSMQFVLTNTGNTTIGNISIGSSGDYSVTPLCGTTTLAPAATCTINVVFSPSAAGTRTGTLTVNSTSSSSPLTAALTGTGLSNLSGLTLSTYSLNLGSYEVGGTGSAAPTLTVTLTNNDTTAITFSAASSANGIAFPIAGDFTSTNNCPQTLAPHAACTLSISFLPTALGTRIGSLTVQSSASNGTQTLTLSGNGTAYTMTTTTPSVTVQQGSTAVFPIALTPVSGYTGAISLTCSGLMARGTACSNGIRATLGPAATVNFSVYTSPKNVGGILGNGLTLNGAWSTRATWVIGLCSLLLLALAGRTRRLAQAAGLLALLMALLLPASGCSGKQPDPNPDATAPGTYTFTLTSLDAAQQSKTLTLTLVVTSQ